jgi:hypothetical protein
MSESKDTQIDWKPLATDTPINWKLLSEDTQIDLNPLATDTQIDWKSLSEESRNNFKNRFEKIQERKFKISEMKIEQKILNLQKKLRKFQTSLNDLERLSLGKQYKIEDLEKEIYELQKGNDIDDDRLNDNDDEVDKEIYTGFDE